TLSITREPYLNRRVARSAWQEKTTPRLDLRSLGATLLPFEFPRAALRFQGKQDLSARAFVEQTQSAEPRPRTGRCATVIVGTSSRRAPPHSFKRSGAIR